MPHLSARLRTGSSKVHAMPKEQRCGHGMTTFSWDEGQRL
jgi:hypothetical protein